jgi:Zn-dependent protease
MPNLTPEILAMGMLWYLVFLFSTTCHEAAHALAAKLGGDLTAFHGGQVSLSPLPHIQREPFGMVIVPVGSFLLSGGMFGWASAPYDLEWQQRYPRRAALMALAGPAANFSLMLLAALILREGEALGMLPAASPERMLGANEAGGEGLAGFFATLLVVFFFLNLLLGTFNLIPVPPLDGSSGIMLLMTERVALRYLNFIREPMFSLAGLLAAWWLFGKILPALFVFAWLLFFPR